MIVVAIIGILATIAIPAYQDYVIRSKISEAVMAASACKTIITETSYTGKRHQWHHLTKARGLDFGYNNSMGKTQYAGALTTYSNGTIAVVVNLPEVQKEKAKWGVPYDLGDIVLIPYKDADVSNANNIMQNADWEPGRQKTIKAWQCLVRSKNRVIKKEWMPKSCRDDVIVPGWTDSAYGW